MAVFTAEAEKVSGLTYGYSFYVGWVSFALSLILSIALAVSFTVTKKIRIFVCFTAIVNDETFSNLSLLKKVCYFICSLFKKKVPF